MAAREVRPHHDAVLLRTVEGRSALGRTTLVRRGGLHRPSTGARHPDTLSPPERRGKACR